MAVFAKMLAKSTVKSKKLDRSKSKYFTCCGLYHVKKAFVFLVLETMLTEVLASLYLIIHGIETSAKEIVTEIVLYIIVISALVGCYFDNKYLLVPYILQMGFMLFLEIPFLCFLLVCVFIPHGAWTNVILPLPLLTTRQRVQIFLTLTVANVFVLLITYWYFSVGLKCYFYFQDIADIKMMDKKKEKENLLMFEGSSQNDKPFIVCKCS